MAGLDPDTFEGGLEYPVFERGANLSGGSRQKLGIARVLLRNPRLIVMDEATSALDGNSESVLSQSLQHLRQQKRVALLAITNKDWLLALCDSVFQLDHGKLT
jgi:ABC-type bacteriocin/lantibiotic exporter with double-glycine peptidase domain